VNIEAMKQVLEVLTDQGRLDPNEYKKKKNESISSLRQAIAKTEKQEPVAILQRYPSKGLLTVDYTDEITEVQEGTWPLYTTPQQRKPLTDEDFLDWYGSAIWGNEDFKQCCQIAFEAGWQAAHGIKGEA
jgi:hypothetical protein